MRHEYFLHDTLERNSQIYRDNTYIFWCVTSDEHFVYYISRYFSEKYVIMRLAQPLSFRRDMLHVPCRAILYTR